MQHDPSAVPVANDFFPPFSAGEMRARRARVQGAMAEHGLDALVIWGAFGWGTSPGQFNASWIANYAGVGQCYVVLPREGDPTLVITTAPHVRNARALTHGLDIRAGLMFLDEMTGRVKALAPGRIGIVGPYGAMPGMTLPEPHWQALATACPNAALEVVTEWFEHLQLTKSDEEIALLRRAGQLGDHIYGQLLAATKPGVTDTELRRVIGHACVDAGATLPFSHIGSFATASPEDFYPDFYPTQSPIRSGDVMQTELCVGFGNYWNKIWGSWFVGRPPQAYLEMHALALEMHESVIAALRSGVACADIDALTRPALDRGYTLNIPLVMGWSMLNHGPLAGAVEGSRWHERARRWRDASFAARQAVTVIVWLGKPGTNQGLWMGTSGVITQDGFERFNGEVSTRLNVV